MKTKTFFEMNNKELNSKIDELKVELFNLRFKHEASQLPNPMVLATTKKDIAKAKTILRQRELGISVEPVSETSSGGIVSRFRKLRNRRAENGKKS
jgi:large subunit ribosomal protein L29